MMMLSDGDNLYIIHNGRTRVYQNFFIEYLDEIYKNTAPDDTRLGDVRVRMDYTSIPEINIKLEGSAEEVQMIDKKINLEEKWKEDMTVQELLDIFNKEVEKREVE